MIIRLAVIPDDDIDHVRIAVDALRNAVNDGNMDDMDEATGRLLTLTSGKDSINLSESQWREFLAETRAGNPAFQSDYLLSGGVCSAFFSHITPEATVLQIPLDGEEEDV